MSSSQSSNKLQTRKETTVSIATIVRAMIANIKRFFRSAETENVYDGYTEIPNRDELCVLFVYLSIYSSNANRLSRLFGGY